jgi:beta-RFAP synthase
MPPLSVLDIAETLGRASRSSIGSLGFRGGGLIVDYGKYPGEQCVAFQREVVPSEWRFVLMAHRDQQGLMGAVETQAFAQLPPVPESVTDKLHQISNSEITSAVVGKNCVDFGEAVYQFGRLAGECFARVQGGPYASAHIAELIQAIRDYGIPGVGQSSWGPTVFAITPNDDEARSLVRWFTERYPVQDYDVTIAHPNNTGAQVNTL